MAKGGSGIEKRLEAVMPKEAPLNGDAPADDDNTGDAPVGPRRRVSEMQAKLHRWAVADPGRRFDDLFNLVHDPATLMMAWDRVATNRGANTAGSDGWTVTRIETEVGVTRFLDDLRMQIKSGEFRPQPVRERKIPKPGGSGKVRRLGIPTVADRVVQAALKLVLEPIFEADFEPVSYGFRPERRAHDAIAEIHLFGTKGYRWVLDADIEACFDSIDHAALMDRVRVRVKDKRVVRLVKAFLKAGILTELGDFEDTGTGTPQGGIFTPPTQWITRTMVALRVGLGLVVGEGGVGAVADRDAVPDGDLLGSDEDVLDQQPQHSLTLLDAGDLGRVAQLGEEALEVVGEFEVELTVGELGVEGVDLAAQAGFARPQVGHPAAQLVDGEQVFLERLDHVHDRLGGLGELRGRMPDLRAHETGLRG